MSTVTIGLRTSLAFLVAATALSCGEQPAKPHPRNSPIALSTPRDAVCDLSYQVAQFEVPTQCNTPVPLGWTASPLFSGPVPSGLRQYCSYTFAGSATEGDVDDLEQALVAPASSGVQLGTDCRAVDTQNSAITPIAGAHFRGYFEWLAGYVSPDAVAGSVPLLPRVNIHTAVVDTYPSFPIAPADPHSSHGPVIASIIESVVCESGETCSDRVRTYLGLPRGATNSDVSTTRGGRVGLQTDLARGIVNALQADASANSQHLVINLSVAWEAEEFGGMDVDDMEPPTRAVYDALRVARCRGALTFAAAGNQSTLSCTGEPMAPARWEDIAAPTMAECADLGVANPSQDTGPLLYAVGGLYGPNLPMANSRAAAMPQLAAASSHATASTRDGLPLPAVSTGTSVATAVSTATASLLWSYRPELEPSQVVQTMVQSGHSVQGHTADFGSPGAQVRRVDICAAFNAAVPTAGLPCNAPLITPLDIWNVIEPAVTENAMGPGFDPLPRKCTSVCGDDFDLYVQQGSTRDCPAVEADPWQWLTTPQPTKSGCQECSLHTNQTQNTDTAILTVTDAFASHDVKGVELEIHDDVGNVFMYSVADDDLANGAVVPRVGEITEYVVPLALDGIDPARAFVLISFIDGDESIQTRDAMLVSESP